MKMLVIPRRCEVPLEGRPHSSDEQYEGNVPLHSWHDMRMTITIMVKTKTKPEKADGCDCSSEDSRRKRSREDEPSSIAPHLHISVDKEISKVGKLTTSTSLSDPAM